MSVHVTLLRETLAANGTCIWLFLGVHRSDMGLEVAFLGKTLATTFAAVVLHSGVNLDVRVHISFLSKTFSTNL